MSKITLFIPLLFVLLVGCSDDKSETKEAVEPEVEYFSLHALCASLDATPERVQEFMDLGVDVNEKKGEYGITPLMYASRSTTNVDVVRLLLKSGADVSMNDEREITSLHLAAQSNGNPEVISLLLKAGAEINAKEDEFGRTPLHLAAQSNGNPEVISLLLKAGAEINAKDDQFSTTPLHLAAHANANPEVVSVLLKAGADINAKNFKFGRTPLHYAAMENANSWVIYVLIKAGADSRLLDNDGKTALDYARENEALQGTNALKELEAATNQ